MIFKHSWTAFPKLHSLIKYRNYSNSPTQATAARIMAEHNYPGKFLTDILQRLEAFAPLTLAESWDNVGLLVDPMDEAPIKNILLTNDLTEDVVEEAVKVNAELIVSYHPNIFQGLKSVSSRTWKERIVVKCIKNNIAVFSPHTSWDAVQGGVNDWLAKAFTVSSATAINQNSEDPLVGAGRLCNLTNPVGLQQALANIKSHIGIPYLRLAVAKGKTESDTISSVALCAGSGSTVLRGVKADLYLTGEMLHHDILDATQKGIHVVLCNHSDSERGFLKTFQPKLQHELLENQVGVLVSQSDHDPLKTV